MNRPRCECWEKICPVAGCVEEEEVTATNNKSLSRFGSFCFSKNLLYLHNCRHDVRRHIREAKCVDIRHKTTCRVTIDTCPLLSFLCLVYRTSQAANNFETTATHEKQETQGTKPKFSKQQTTNQNPGVLQNSNHFFSFVLGEIEIRVVKCHV